MKLDTNEKRNLNSNPSPIYKLYSPLTLTKRKIKEREEDNRKANRGLGKACVLQKQNALIIQDGSIEVNKKKDFKMKRKLAKNIIPEEYIALI